MKIAGLEIAGFAEFTNISESHLYALLNGNREITQEICEKIADKFEIPSSKLFNVRYKLTDELKNTTLLKRFYAEEKQAKSYFLQTKVDRKPSIFIERELYDTGFFDKQVTVSEVRKACLKRKRNYTSKQISQILTYMVDQKFLRKKKNTIVLANG